MRHRLPQIVPAWPLLLALALPILLAVGALTAVLALAPAPSPQPRVVPVVGSPGGGGALPPPAFLLVHVSGAVVHPGIYRLHRGDRVDSAIAAAGGTTAEADPQRAPNLAGRLRDGQQVRVPFVKGPASARPGRVPLNTASADELAGVPGFTAQLALEVVNYRDSYGPFTSLSQLVSVLGMSRADYLLAKAHLAL